MTIVNKKFGFGKGLVALVTVLAFALTGVSSSVSGQGSSVTSLQDQLAQLKAQLVQLQGGSTLNATLQPVVAAASPNTACPYSWSRNLGIGSTGEDVRKLQQFLNGDVNTRVSTTGAGSVNFETTYYGKGTASAVTRFQNKYAGEILTPIGLSQGTGYFGAGTRAKANALCTTVTLPATSAGNTATVTTTQPNQVVSGGGLSVRAGKQPRDGFAVLGAQRVPFTVFSLTAGNSAVQVDGVTVRKEGLSNDDFIESVALVDNRGFQLGSARSFRRDDEAVIGGSFVVPRGETVTFTVVGNVSGDDNDVDAGDIAQINVVDVNADASVSGLSNPIEGAVHAGNSSLDLSVVTVEPRGRDSEEVEVSEEDVEFAEIRVEVGSQGDEDALLKSITLENKGTLDLDDINDLTVSVDSEDYDFIVDGDRLSVVFPGRGLEIREGKREDITITGTPAEGSNRTVKFEVDDESDVYVLGARYEYGLPVEISEDDFRTVTVRRGDAESQTVRLSASDREVVYGDDRPLGAFGIEVDEDHEFDAMIARFVISGLDNAALNPFRDNDRQLEISSIKLVDEDGNTVASADDDIEFDVETTHNLSEDGTNLTTGGSPSFDNGTLTVDVEFDEQFDLDKGRHTLFIVGDLESDWVSAGIRFSLSIESFDDITALESDEDYTPQEIRDFVAGLSSREYRLEESSVDVDLRSVGNNTVVEGRDDVRFAELSVNARNTTHNVVLDTMTILAKATGLNADVTDIESCSVRNEEGDSVSSTERVDEESTSGTGANAESTSEEIEFDLRDYEVKKGSRETLYIECSLAAGISEGVKFNFFTDADDLVEYSIDDRDESPKFGLDDSYGIITVSGAGAVTARAETEDIDAVQAVATGSRSSNLSVTSGVIQFTAENENVEIDEVVLQFGEVVSGSAVVSNSRDGSGGVNPPSGKENEIEAYIETVRILTNDGEELDEISGGDISSSTGRVTFDFSGNEFIVETDPDDNADNNLKVDITFKHINEDSEAYSGPSVVLALVSAGGNGEDSGNAVTADLGTARLSTSYVYTTYPEFILRSNDFSGTLRNGDDVYYDFAVRNAGDRVQDALSIGQLAFNISIGDRDSNNSLGLYDINLYAYTNSSRNNTVGGFQSNGVVSRLYSSGTNAYTAANAFKTGGDVKLLFNQADGTAGTEGALEIDGADTVYFRLEAKVTGVELDDNVSIRIVTDEAPDYPRWRSTTATNSNIAWTPQSFGESYITNHNNFDWVNGYPVLDESDADEIEFRFDE
jgi:hypothetical protein